MGIKQLRKEEKGSGLVLTLMILLVLSVLGIAIGTLTIGSYRLSDATRDDTSAYYVAEAGAVAAYDQIQREVLDAYNKNATESAFYNEVSTLLTKKNGQSNVDFDQQLGNKPSATIRTKKVDAQNYTIYSTGEIAGKERTVTKPLTVKWVGKNTGGGLPAVPTNAALLTQKGMELKNGSLIGNIHTNSKDTASIIISGNPTFQNTNLYYPSATTAEKLIVKPKNWTDSIKSYVPREKNVDFGNYQFLLDQLEGPMYSSTDFVKLPDKTVQNNNGNKHEVQKNGNLFVNNYVVDSYRLDVQNNISFNKIIVDQGYVLTINLSRGNHTIAVEDLIIGNGKINIEGEGTLTLVIKNSFKISSGGVLNKTVTPNKLSLVYLGDEKLEFGNDIKINGHMLVKKANVSVSSVPINGVFLTGGKKVEFSGGSPGSNMMLIAPKADVVMIGSYHLRGTIIANKFEMNGAATLEYAPVDTTGFPFGSSGTVTKPKPEDIVNSGTIVED